ncbi:hypothetical protein JKP88DRAFT_326905 [Tribonema minus]|uniref:NECAP PHear domain-containing protein n=1 Tax=Tribonema minus TaxID=303371 RepID=A0A836CAQ5_9STRA|nr:hypothetical protein JKP88DRAFT_326905 [Tribonema minus]
MSTPAAAADKSPSAATTTEIPAAAPAEKQDSAAEQADSGDGDGEPSRVEVPLLYIKEVFVYRVPPAKAASGHRAEEWGLENPALTGFMRISQLDDQSLVTLALTLKEAGAEYAVRWCLVKMFVPPKEGDLGAAAQLFATCCIRVGGGRFLQHFVEHVMDSSRYFVLRCEDQAGSGRVAYVGVGFRERSTAFDFKAALDDYVRSVQRQQQAERLRDRANSVDAAEDGSSEQRAPLPPVPDLSLHAGQKIHLSLPGGGGSGGSGGGGSGGSSAHRRPQRRTTWGEGAGLVPPPPGGLVPPPPGDLTIPAPAATAAAAASAGPLTPMEIVREPDAGAGGGGSAAAAAAADSAAIASGEAAEGDAAAVGRAAAAAADEWGDFASA